MRPHRDGEQLAIGDLSLFFGGQTAAFGAEHERVIGPVLDFGVGQRGSRGEAENPTRKSGEASGHVGVDCHVGVFVIVKAAALQEPIGELETQGLNEMQSASSVSAEADYGPRIGRNLWANKYYVHSPEPRVMSMARTKTALTRLEQALDRCGPRIVACSGGIDSLLLATVAHRRAPATTTVAHTMSPAVPAEGTARVVDHAHRHGWRLELVRSEEFADERYLTNPTDRCYYCKTNLYDALAALDTLGAEATIVSGANLDDLGEYRPGLVAAAEHQVRHPFVEADIDKETIRDIARSLGLPEADLPASPCLASRLYTGTRVTEARLRAVEAGEAVIRAAGVEVVRCRVRTIDAANEAVVEAIVEVLDEVRGAVTAGLLADLARVMQAIEPSIIRASLDERPYRPGRAILLVG